MSANWHVYLALCQDGSLYCGIAVDVAKRLEQHNQGNGSKYVRSRLPAVLVWSAAVGDKSTALRREAALKRLRKAAKEALVVTRSRSIV